MAGEHAPSVWSKRGRMKTAKSLNNNMKIKMVYWIGFALAVAMVSAGCKSQVSVIKPGDTWPAPGLTKIPPAGTVAPGYSPGKQAAEQPISPPADRMPGVNTQNGTALAAVDTVYFDYDSSVIRDGAHLNLQSVTAALQADPDATLLVEGNCDERGTEEYNRSLGERRALAARAALAPMGIDPQRVSTVSYGKDKPADPGYNHALWWKNRRDDFVLLHPKTGA